MLRVAFAHYNSAEDISGVTSWLLRLATDLRQRDVQVGVYLTDLSAADTSGLSPLEQALREVGVETFRSPLQPTLKADVEATLAFLNTWKPDVFLPQCKGHHYLAAAIAGRAGLPWALTLHSDDEDYWAVLADLPPQNNGGVCVCVSRHIHALVQSRGGEANAAVIPYGVSIPGARSIYQHAPFRVVYCGRLWEHQKRISLVTQTLIKVCRLKDVNIQATLIGDGYCKADCEQVVSEAGLTGRISFLGRQSFARIQAELLQSQAILLMSDFEGLPVALLEAMAVGVVPVTRSIPSGIPELVRHRETGLLTTEHPDDAAAAIGTLARDRHLWNHCSNQARALVLESFNQDRSHNSWYILLKNLQEKAEIKYPISSFHGVRLSRLSPFLQGAHHKPPFWRSKKLAQGLNMGMAILKGKLKKVLKPSA